MPLNARHILVLIPYAVVAATSAHATDTWTDPYPGIRRLHRVTSNQNINVVVVNLCAPGISVRATASSERGRTVSSWGNLVGAKVAVNGDFFSFSDYSTDGFTLHDGAAWPGSHDHSYVGQIAFGTERVEMVRHDDVLGAPAPWWKEVVSSHPTILWDGNPIDNNGDTSLCGANRHPRTASGLSQDKRTLIIMNADGRHVPDRIGLTCDEESALMKEMGAWWAMNHDGGGSAEMWMGGAVLNHPSDGNERVVGNHLGVMVTGNNVPAHCERTLDEVFYNMEPVQHTSTSDLDGDGKADVCARDSLGIVCSTSNGAKFNANFRGPALSDASQWWWPTYSQSLRLGDFTGDGKADLCTRFNDGVHCWPSTGTGFGAEITIAALAGDAWQDFDNWSTLVMGDVTGDGKDDLCARSDTGFKCWPSNGAGFGAAISGPALSNANGWTDPSVYGTIRLGDVNGDGKLDVCARGHVQVDCWLSNGTAFPTHVDGPPWTSFVGFGLVKYWSTFRLADVNGDGKADACIRGSTDYRCHLSTGTGFGPAIIGPALEDKSGWDQHQYYSTIRLLDMDGDGDLDLCVRSAYGVICWKWTGSDFSTTAIVGPPLGNGPIWSDINYYRTIRTGDVNGDGKDDICARAADGLHCWLSDGNAFPTQLPVVSWSDAAGWNFIHTASIRISGPQKYGPEICGNGKDDNRNGKIDEGCGGNGGGSGGNGGGNTGGGGGTGGTAGGGAGGSGGSGGGGAPGGSGGGETGGAGGGEAPGGAGGQGGGTSPGTTGGCGCGAPNAGVPMFGLGLLLVRALVMNRRRGAARVTSAPARR